MTKPTTSMMGLLSAFLPEPDGGVPGQTDAWNGDFLAILHTFDEVSANTPADRVPDQVLDLRTVFLSAFYQYGRG